MPSIPVVGSIRLEDGLLRFYNDRNEVCGVLFVGPQGAVFEMIVGKGEFTFLQANDPPSVKVATLPTAESGDRVKLGKVSFNLMRYDGICEELAFFSGATAEDSDYQSGDLRGQLEMFVRPSTDVDAQQVFVATTAYADEAMSHGVPPTDPRTNRRSIWVGVRNFVFGLWKFD